MKRIIDTQELVDKQVISEEVANDIIHYYQNKKGVMSNASLPLIIVAIIFIVTGSIFLIEDNWKAIPIFLQDVIALLPLVISTIGCYHVYRHKLESRGWKEGICLFQCFSICITFLIIDGIYDIKVSSSFVFILFAFLFYPFVFIFQSVIASSLIIAIVCFLINEFTELTRLPLPIIGIMDLCFLYDFYYKKRNTFLCKFRTAILPILILLAWVLSYEIIDDLFDSKSSDLIMVICAIIMSCWSFSLHTWIRDSQNIASNATMLKISSFVAIYLSLSIMTNEFEKLDEIKIFTALNIILLVSAIVLFLVSLYHKKKRGKPIEMDEWVALLTIPIIICASFSMAEICHITATVLLALYLGYLTYTGIRSHDLVKLNIALVGWYAYMFQTMGIHELSSVIMGVFSIVWGVVLILINYYLHAKRKNVRNEEIR